MGATLLRSGDRTSFGSALHTRRRAEPDAVVKIGTYGPCAEFIKTAPIGSARMRRFYFNLVHHDEVEPIGHPVADRGQAIAVAQRLAIDIAENRQDCLGKGYSVSIVDDAGIEIHRESVDNAEKERLMIARLSALDATFAPRGPQEGIMGKTLRIIIDPKANRTTPMSSIARPAPACGIGGIGHSNSVLNGAQ